MSTSSPNFLIVAPRRGLRRLEAAQYVGVSPSKFDQLVKDGRMPKSIHIDGCSIWDINMLNYAFDELALPSGKNEWDSV